MTSIKSSLSSSARRISRARATTFLRWSIDKCAIHGRLRCPGCRCPVCGVGIVLESSTIDWCSRRYDPRLMCDGPFMPVAARASQ